MIEYKEIEQTKKYKMPKTITCDICNKTIDYEDETMKKFEALNFISIRKCFGYGSDIGDEDTVSIDVCEECFIKKFGMDFIQKHIVEEER